MINVNANCQAELPDLSELVAASAHGCGALAVTQSPPAGTPLDIGETVVTITAQNAAGHTADCTATVAVVDSTPPAITGCPANMTKNTDPDSCAAVVSWTEPTVIDNCAGASIARTNGSAPGSPFPKGVTSVTYTATDAHGNTSTCSFIVTISDHQAPTITTCPPARSIPAGANCVAAIPNLVNELVANDNCSGPVTITQSPTAGTTVGLGSHQVTIGTADQVGNPSSCVVQISVTSTDSDGDGTPDCADGCPNDPNKISPGACGCGVPDTLNCGQVPGTQTTPSTCRGTEICGICFGQATLLGLVGMIGMKRKYRPRQVA